MVVLLNSLGIIILLVGLILAYTLHKPWPLLVALFLFFIYGQVQPSYMPKGEIHRSELPPMEQKDIPLENRQLAPKSMEQYDKERNQQIQQGLPFVEKK